jgi:nicotinate-nucleotide adenylyltransferase
LICLFGGTFDPVHNGHLHAAEAVLAALGISQIRLVLSARPSHKDSTGASLEQRWEMLNLACADNPALIPDDREMHRQRPSYTVETLEAIRAESPQEELVWVIGSDAFALLESWYRWQEVLELANLIVLRRPGGFPEMSERMVAYTEAHQVESLVDCHKGGIFMLEDSMQEVSAQDIRAAVAAGRDVSHLIPPPVALYIREHRLYGGAAGS